MGVDGEVVAAVESRRRKHKGVTATRYIRSAIPAVLRSARREPTLTLELADRDPVTGCALRVRVELQSVDVRQRPAGLHQPRLPLRNRAGRVRHHEHGRLAKSVAGAADAGQAGRHQSPHLVRREDDVAWVRITSDTPIATQIDGDYLGLREEMTFRAVAGGSDVVAPPQKLP